jgi:hypothetical protein
MRGNDRRRRADPCRCGNRLGWCPDVRRAGVDIAALLYFYEGGTDQDRAGLDVVRTAGTLVVGAAGRLLCCWPLAVSGTPS